MKLEQKISALKMEINSYYGLTGVALINLQEDRVRLKGYLRRVYKIDRVRKKL